MKATAEKVEKNTVMLEVEIEPEKFQAATEKAYKKIVKQVNIPGFRKGKTPRVILERYIGKKALYDEAVEIIIPDAYMDAVKDTGIEPVSQPDLELVQVEEGKPMIFKAKVVVKPEVKLGQYLGLEVARPQTEVTDEDVQKELEMMQERYAKLITLEEGSVEKGDMLKIDFEGKVDGVPFEGGSVTDFTLEIGSGSFIPGFEDGIVGMTINETKDIALTFPADYNKGDLAGKDAVFTVTVKEIKRKELAPLDDEFAKDVSEKDTLEELRSEIANKLKEAAQERAQAQMRREVLVAAVKNAEIDVPEEMIERRIEDMIRDLDMRLSSQGISMEKYLQYTNTSLDDFKKNLRPDAEESVRQTLVVDAIVQAEKLEVSEEDLNAEIEKMSKQLHQSADNVKMMLESEDQMEFFKEGILRDKAMQLMVDQAVMTDGTNNSETE